MNSSGSNPTPFSRPASDPTARTGIARGSVRSPRERLLDTGALVARLLIGALFIYMGYIKAREPVEFLKLLRQYDLTATPWLLNSIAAALPWFEIVCGALLISGVAVRGTALLLIFMLVPFTGIVIERAMDMQSALNIAFCAVKFDCGCGTGEVFICRKIFENALILGGCVLLVAGWGKPGCVRHSLFRTAAGEEANHG